jgi:hypothetical protein
VVAAAGRAEGVSAMTLSGGALAAVRHCVDYQVAKGAISPEQVEHALGWCVGWLLEVQPRLTPGKYCVHTQALAAVTAYLDEFLPVGCGAHDRS